MKICARCGTPFEPKDERANRPAKYCSRGCAQPNRKARVTLTCRQCGEEFERKRYMQDWSQERGPFCGFQCYSAWQAQHTCGAANPFHDPDCWIMLACHRCGKEIRRRRLDHQRGASVTGRAFCSRECFEVHARETFPRNSYNWTSKVWRRARMRALRRDGYHCQDCGATEDLTVHHLKPFAEFRGDHAAHELDNLLTVCRACHRVRHNQLRAESR